jgi:hypothetical protein
MTKPRSEAAQGRARALRYPFDPEEAARATNGEGPMDKSEIVSRRVIPWAYMWGGRQRHRHPLPGAVVRLKAQEPHPATGVHRRRGGEGIQRLGRYAGQQQ